MTVFIDATTVQPKIPRCMDKRYPSLKNWLTVVESTQEPTAKCKICNKILSNKYADLKGHGESRKHVSHSGVVFGKEQTKLQFKDVQGSACKTEVFFCVKVFVLSNNIFIFYCEFY